MRAAFAKILAIAPPEPRRLIALQLNRWDVANVLALLRGKLAAPARASCLAAVLPIGELDEVQLGELAAEIDVANLADALTTWKHAFAFALRRAIRECTDQDDMAALESALYRAYFQWALSQLNAEDPRHGPVRDILRRQIDLVNVITLLELIRDRERGGGRENIEPIPRGKLPRGPAGGARRLRHRWKAASRCWAAPTSPRASRKASSPTARRRASPSWSGSWSPW